MTDKAKPDQQCDLVMKGGITSGVVYPKALTELAKQYRFVNVGGTSAGAIAAAFAAAAEYNRAGGGFDRVDQLPQDIGSRLLSLFQPAKQHKRIFKAVLHLRKGNKVRGYSSLLWKLRSTLKNLPKTYFGFCTGLTQGDPNLPGLTDWLNLELERVAGRLDESGHVPPRPLTFGDLRRRGITLRTIATDLSKQTPVTLPFPSRVHMRVEDVDALLPANIARWLKRNQASEDGLVAIPAGDRMPVLLAVRLSLSFPLLLAAVPIYRRDRSLRLCAEEMRAFRATWLSDGGISSNFPIHLFDQPLPTRPTFGISLDQFTACRQEPDEQAGPGDNRIFLPKTAGQGIQLPINAVNSVPAFLGAILAAARNWQDSVQSTLPGYRERIVHIALKEDSEGGANLNMPKPLIDKLTHLGHLAGKRINEGFDFDEHRWRRVLSAYAAIEESFESLNESWNLGGPESFRDFMLRYRAGLDNNDGVARSYPPADQARFELLFERMDALAALAGTMAAAPIRDRWSGNNKPMPRPRPALRLFPREFTD